MKATARNDRAREAARLVFGCAAFVLACGFALPRASESVPAAPALAAALPPADRADIRAAEAAADAGGAILASAPEIVAVPPRMPPRRAFAAPGEALAWKAVHGRVDGRRWRSGAPPKSPVHGRRLHGIGFPAVASRGETPAYRPFGLNGIPDSARREGERVYRTVVAWREAEDVPGGRQPIPHLRCMGLSPEAVARRAARYEVRIVELSMEHDVSASLVKAVITEESCFDPKALSPVGAIGLMQLMPATAKWLGVKDPRRPDDNLRGGIRYLAMLKAQYGGNTSLALAAYNAGPGNVRRYAGIPPFAETRRYVRRVLANHRRYVAATTLASR